MSPTSALRGSQLRCQIFAEGPRPEVAVRLTRLAEPTGARVTPDDVWRPGGREDPREARLEREPALLSPVQREALLDWWLAVRRGANTPNWDIASTCTIEGGRGLLLAEAKAHHRELSPAGKLAPGTPNGWRNHERIGEAIAEANAGLNALRPGWALSRDTHYQLCNRLAWVWKLADLGVPVVLAYLGFLHAEEMRDQGEPFRSTEAWRACVSTYAAGLVPHDAWGGRLEWAGTPLWLLAPVLDLACG